MIVRFATILLAVAVLALRPQPARAQQCHTQECYDACTNNYNDEKLACQQENTDCKNGCLNGYYGCLADCAPGDTNCQNLCKDEKNSCNAQCSTENFDCTSQAEEDNMCCTDYCDSCEYCPRRKRPHALAAGVRISLDGADFARARQTVLIALSSHCSFCRTSTPFYRALSDLHRAHPAMFQLIVISRDERSEIAGFLAQAHIAVDTILSVPPATIGVAGTPALLVLDEQGRVRNDFAGRLPPDREQLVLQLLNNAGARPELTADISMPARTAPSR